MHPIFASPNELTPRAGAGPELRRRGPACPGRCPPPTLRGPSRTRRTAGPSGLSTGWDCPSPFLRQIPQAVPVAAGPPRRGPSADAARRLSGSPAPRPPGSGRGAPQAPWRPDLGGGLPAAGPRPAALLAGRGVGELHELRAPTAPGFGVIVAPAPASPPSLFKPAKSYARGGTGLELAKKRAAAARRAPTARAGPRRVPSTVLRCPAAPAELFPQLPPAARPCRLCPPESPRRRCAFVARAGAGSGTSSSGSRADGARPLSRVASGSGLDGPALACHVRPRAAWAPAACPPADMGHAGSTPPVAAARPGARRRR